MKYVNRQIIAGYVGNNPELRHLNNGLSVLELSVATANSWKDKAGEWNTDTEWHNCIFYRDDAEKAHPLYRKGDGIYLEGRTHTRKWKAKDGHERSRKEIIVELHNKIDAAAMKVSKNEESPALEASSEEVPLNISAEGFVA